MGQSSSQQQNGSVKSSLMRRASSLGTPTSRLRSFRSPFSRRKNKKAPLSATFTAPCSANLDTLNINTATVEQLMTLEGIDRAMAESIVEYRTRIGGRFQKIDDLALVSGMGAERLDRIRSEICVRRKMLMSASMNGSVSSRTPSIDSISFGDSLTATTATPKVNINSATVFQLQQLNGLNQELAAKIVDYRNRKGSFKTVDQLIRVKGISSTRLAAIRSFLCATSNDSASSFNSFTSTPMKLMNGGSVETDSSTTTTPSRMGSHRKSVSVPVKMNYKLLNGGFQHVPINDIFDLLGAYSHRPTVEEDFRYERNGHRALRVASWNLDRMTLPKAENPGVLEVVCRTILENKLSIVCVQEVADPKALAKICDELNEPTLKRVSEWRENTKHWKYIVSGPCLEGSLSGLGFIYDNHHCKFIPKLSQEIELGDFQQESLPKPSCYLAAFELEDWTLNVLNIYLRYFDMSKTTALIRRIEGGLGTTMDSVFMVVGDFTRLTKTDDVTMILNETSRTTKVKSDWQLETNLDVNLDEFDYNQVFGPDSTSFADNSSGDQGIDNGIDVAVNKKNSKSSSCNILCKEKPPLTRDLFREAIYKSKDPSEWNQVPSAGENWKKRSPSDRLTGHLNVIREGLCHMAIPRNWVWGGPASEHCPIWIELYQRVNKFTPITTTTTTIKQSNGCAAKGELLKKLNGLTLSNGTTIESSLESLQAKEVDQSAQ